MTNMVVSAVRRPAIQLLMAFIIGFGLATVLRSPCKGFLCRRFVAPDLEAVKDTLWRHGTGCLKVSMTSLPCDQRPEDIVPVIAA